MTDVTPTDDTAAMADHRSLWRNVWDQYSTHKGALIGTVIFLLICLAVTIGP